MRHRGLPFLASRAKKSPSIVPEKTRPPAVENNPHQGGVYFELPGELAGQRVESPQGAVRFLAGDVALCRSQIQMAGLVLGFCAEVNPVFFAYVLVKQLGLRAVEGAEPVGSAVIVRVRSGTRKRHHLVRSEARECENPARWFVSGIERRYNPATTFRFSDFPLVPPTSIAAHSSRYRYAQLDRAQKSRTVMFSCRAGILWVEAVAAESLLDYSLL